MSGSPGSPPPADPVLITERLTLRRFRWADVGPLHAIFADPEAMRFWSTTPHRAVAETRAFVRATMTAAASDEGDDFVVVRDGEVIGKAGLWDNREIGFLLARSQWGQGLASEAVRAILARAAQRGVEKVLADVDPRNHASLRLLERAGFVRTGAAARTARIGGVWVDSVYLERTLALTS